MMIGAGLVGYGYHLGVEKLWEYQAEQARAAVPVIVKQGEVTEKVVAIYMDRIVKVKGETTTITKEIDRYVPLPADPMLPVGWLLLHDAAATRAVPAPAEGVDVSSPSLASSAALRGIAENYGTCHATAEHLVALQQWVRHQYETMNQEPLRY